MIRRIQEQFRSADGAIVLVIVLFFILFFWSALFGGRFLLAGDPLLYSYPLRTVAWEMIKHGSLPLWTPLIFSGYPLLSMAQLGLAYPFTWGYLFLPGRWAEQVYVLTPYLLAPIFIYVYGREIRLSRMAALLAGLSFSYGGLMLSLIGLNGMLPHAVMWLPLGLIAVERARTRKFAPSLLLATGACAMSALTGIGQGFVYAGCLLGLYAGFIAVFWPVPNGVQEPGQAPDWNAWQRWRPVFVAVVAIVLAVGIWAFQVGETMRASEQSVRNKLSFEAFSYGSFPFPLIWRSLLEPLHNGGDATGFVPLLAFFLAIVAVIKTLFRGPRDSRVIFWTTIVVGACVLMMGAFTPFSRVVYQIPVINRFRVPSRHAFEWTFALSILSAYGWDALKATLERRNPEAAVARRSLRLILALIGLVAGTIFGIVWWRQLGGISATFPLSYNELHAKYLGWKVALFLATFLAIWQCFKLSINTARGWRIGLALYAIVLGCFVEPYIQLSHLSIPYSASAERFNTYAPTTQFLRKYSPEQTRVYSQINSSAEAHSPNPHVDPLNLTALAGLQNVGGYEPLMSERYSRALNSSQWDIVNRSAGLTPDPTLFEPRSHVLDLLNAGFVASYSNLRAEPEAYVEKERIKFAANETSAEIGTEPPLVLAGDAAQGDTLALVTTLANAGNISDGAPVARIIIHTADGQSIERALRAGPETAEWAHERADVRPVVRHSLAPVFDARPGDDKNSFPSYRYLARINLGQRQRIARVEIVKLVAQISIILWKASLYDSSAGASAPLWKPGAVNPLSSLDPSRWETVYQQDGALILQNKRALPRAWLTPEAEAVTEEEGWKRIRGLSERPFDPRRTALLETSSGNLPPVSGQPLSASASARIVSYEPNRLVIETNADRPAILVVSELFYPGWAAIVDGAETPIYRTDFLLRGTAVPAGTHRVELRYTAPGARAGAMISLCALLVVGALAIHVGRSKSNNSADQRDLKKAPIL
jgi:hypothetical protein